MREDFVHFLWKSRMIPFLDLKTTTGSQVTIQEWGTCNEDAGPDFLNCKIRLEDQEWCGNIEMHVKSSDWTAHKHEDDPFYDSVILHVVWHHDQQVYTSSGQKIHTVELRHQVSHTLHDRYCQMIKPQDRLPCTEHISEMDGMRIRQWFHRLFIERMESRYDDIMTLVKESRNDWEEAFYKQLCQYFGGHKNKLPFLMLARATPLSLIRKYRDSALQLEALLYGQAGMLSTRLADTYPQELLKEYEYLRWKHQLEPQAPEMWKYLRMRPAGFPSVRISLLADLLRRHVHLFRSCSEAKDAAQVYELFLGCETHEYWDDHYVFDKLSPYKTKRLGKSGVRNLLINVIVPFVFSYAKAHGRLHLVDKVLEWLYDEPAESNRVVNDWKRELDMKLSAATSQSIIQLHQNYCHQRRCMDCAIGCDIMKQIYMIQEPEAYYLSASA